MIFFYVRKTQLCTSLLGLHPLCGGGDLLFLLSPPAAAATCFCSHWKTPTRIIIKYLQYAYWPCGIYPVIFFGVFQLFQQNPRWPPKSYVTLKSFRFVPRKQLTLAIC